MATSLEEELKPVQTPPTSRLGLVSFLLVLLPIIWPALAMLRFGGNLPSVGFVDSLLYAAAAAPAVAIITLAIPLFGILAAGLDLYRKTQKVPAGAALALVSILGMVSVFLFPSSGSLETQYGLMVSAILWIILAVLVVSQFGSARQDRTILALLAIALAPPSFGVIGGFLVVLSFALSWGMSFP